MIPLILQPSSNSTPRCFTIITFFFSNRPPAVILWGGWVGGVQKKESSQIGIYALMQNIIKKNGKPNQKDVTEKLIWENKGDGGRQNTSGFPQQSK